MSSPYWFDIWFKDDIKSDNVKTLGVYTTLLYLYYRLTRRKIIVYSTSYEDLDKEFADMLVSIRSELAKFFVGKRLYEACNAAEEFLERVKSHRVTRSERWFEFHEELQNELENIEIAYYDIFRNACFSFFKGVDTKFVDKIRKLLTNITNVVDRVRIRSTKAGTLILSVMKYPLAQAVLRTPYPSEDEEKRLLELAKELHRAGILFYFDKEFRLLDCGIIPAPYLEKEFIEKILTKSVETIYEADTKTLMVSVPARPSESERRAKYIGRKPAREILEAIVRDVLEDLGYEARSNVKLRTRGGGEIEVDVWAYKRVPRFYIYVSCKNWDKEVDRSVIDQEFGRTLQLIQIPHLKVLVVKKLTEPAKEEAYADGFVVIELGEKATIKNAEEIYDIIYTKLRELFTGIAPPELQHLASEVRRLAEQLREIANRLEKTAR